MLILQLIIMNFLVVQIYFSFSGDTYNMLIKITIF